MQVFKPFQRLDQFLEVLQPPRSLGRFVVLPHGCVAGFVQDHFGQLHVRHVFTVDQSAPAQDAVNQFGQGHPALTLDQSGLHRQPRAFQQRHTVRARGHLDGLLRLVAKTTFGCVHDPLEREIIVGRGHDAEIGHRIADLHPLIEARAADHTIRQTDGQEPILEGAHLVGRPHEDRHLVQVHRSHTARARLRGLDLFADPTRLFLTIPMADQADLFALFGFGPKLFAKPSLIAPNDPGSGPKYVGRRAVILFQPDHMRARKILFKPQDIAHFGPAPAIDRLVIIAHATDVLVPACQQAQPQVLRDVGILVLVHEDISEPALVLRQHVVVGLEYRDHVQQKVAEIDRVQFFQSRLVLRV